MKALIEFLINNPHYMKDLDRIQIKRYRVHKNAYFERCAYTAMASYFEEEWMTRNIFTETVGGYAFDRAIARLESDTDDLQHWLPPD